jgi:hypothetical protein
LGSYRKSADDSPYPPPKQHAKLGASVGVTDVTAWPPSFLDACASSVPVADAPGARATQATRVNLIIRLVNCVAWTPNYNFRGAAKPEMLAMNLLLLLALAIPLSCLALLVSLALLGVLTLGSVIHLVAEVGRVPNKTRPPLDY